MGAAVLLLAMLFFADLYSVVKPWMVVPWDKVAHAIFFLMLTAVLWLAFKRRLVWAAGVALLLGVADELHQAFLPDRTVGLDDWLADVVGVLLAVTILRVRTGARSRALR